MNKYILGKRSKFLKGFLMSVLIVCFFDVMSPIPVL